MSSIGWSKRVDVDFGNHFIRHERLVLAARCRSCMWSVTKRAFEGGNFELAFTESDADQGERGRAFQAKYVAQVRITHQYWTLVSAKQSLTLGITNFGLVKDTRM